MKRDHRFLAWFLIGVFATSEAMSEGYPISGAVPTASVRIGGPASGMQPPIGAEEDLQSDDEATIVGLPGINIHSARRPVGGGEGRVKINLPGFNLDLKSPGPQSK